MLNIIFKRPFISGMVAGAIITRLLKKRIEKLIDGKITIITLQISDPKLINDVCAGDTKVTPNANTENK